MTIINPNSISGISSITALNSTAAINLFKADGTAANIIAGVTTGANFITGTSNVHSTGYECTNINASGIVTAASLDISGDIDFDGHTELDNVNISGVSTFRNELQISPSNASSYATHLNFNNTGSNFISCANSGATYFRNSSSGGTAMSIQGSDKSVDIDSTLRHLGDTDTLMQFGDNSITFSAGNQQVVHILPSSAGSGGARMGLGTNSPTGMLHIYGANPPFRIQNSNDSANLQIGMWDTSNVMFQVSHRPFKLATETSHPIVFHTGGLNNERLRIDTNGRVLFSRGGLTASRNVGTKTGEIQVANSGNSSAITLIGFSNDVGGPHLMFGKSRSTNATGNTIVQSGDRLGEIAFCGNDGSDFDSFGAAIKCHVDGTPGANDMPGRLQFYTTPDGASTSTERLRIDKVGMITLGNPTNTVLKAEINNSVSGHYFVSQCSDNNNGFEIYQQHGSTTTRNTLAVYNNSIGSKHLNFYVRGDNQVWISTVKNNTALVLDGTSSGTAYGETGGRIEFLMLNEVNQFTGNFAARISPYLQRGNNGFGLKFDVRHNASTTYKILDLTADYSVLPGLDNTITLGSSSYRWSNIYTADLHCSNEGSKNDVDGTWGDYTIQEGESDLFLINNRSGKKYKFNLTEVS